MLAVVSLNYNYSEKSCKKGILYSKITIKEVRNNIHLLFVQTHKCN